MEEWVGKMGARVDEPVGSKNVGNGWGSKSEKEKRKDRDGDPLVDRKKTR
jgi:hypothetical protein